MSHADELREIRQAFAHDRYITAAIDDGAKACKRYLVANEKLRLANEDAKHDSANAETIHHLEYLRNAEREKAVRAILSYRKCSELIGIPRFQDIPFSQEAFEDTYANIVDTAITEVALSD